MAATRSGAGEAVVSTAGSGHGRPLGQLKRRVDRARAGLERGAAGRRRRARAGVHGRAGRAGGAPPPRRLPSPGAARGGRRRPAAGAGARRADAAGGYAAAARAAPGLTAAVLRARHGVPGLRVPPQPVPRRPDGRRAPRCGEGDRHVHPLSPTHRPRRQYA